MKVALIETASSTAPGSMRRYADLVQLAFNGHGDIEIVRINVSGSRWVMNTLPRRFRNWGHHAVVAWNAWLMRKAAFDVLHIVDGSHAYIAPLLPRNRTAVTVHDVIPYLQVGGHFPVAAPSRFASWLIHRSLDGLRQVNEYLIVSQSTRDDLSAAGIATSPAAVCPLTLEPELFGPVESADAEKANRPRILHVGNNGFYKNRAGVVEVFARVRQDMDAELVMVGPAPLQPLRDRIDELGLQSDVSFIVDPDDHVLRDLYRHSSLLLFPSIYEGFGWPPLEAMASGCPVVCSTAGSLPEVVGDAALVADPSDCETLAGHCLRILREPNFAAEQRRRGFAQSATFGLERFRQTIEAAYRRIVTKNRPESETAESLTETGCLDA